MQIDTESFWSIVGVEPEFPASVMHALSTMLFGQLLNGEEMGSPRNLWVQWVEIIFGVLLKGFDAV